jgi:hypothetical protein
MSDHIRLSLYLDEPVFSENQLSALESLIADYLPGWGATYQLSEDDPKFGFIRKDATQSLFDAVNHHFPVKWGQSSAVLSSNHNNVVMFLDTSKTTLPPELNSIGIEIVSAREPNAKSVTVRAAEFFLGAVEQLSVRYGCGYDRSEFEAKNIIRNDNGVSAVGVRLGAAIPGLYWLNFFGTPYLDMIGSSRFLSLPAGSIIRRSSGIVIKLADDPDDWRTQDYRCAERKIVEHLGSDYFFNPEIPEQATQAPDFRLQSK